MKPADQLSEFVRQGLAQGATPEVIVTALSDAGWSAPEIDQAVSAWHLQSGLPPVPRPRPYASAQEALLYALLFLSLGAIAWHLCQLGLALIDGLFPTPEEIAIQSDASVRWSIAALVAFTPLFVLLDRRIARLGLKDAGRRRSLVRKWSAAITLLVASLVLLSDAIYVIYALLNGDLTLRFLLKAGLVAVISGLVLAYYRDEMDA